MQQLRTVLINISVVIGLALMLLLPDAFAESSFPIADTLVLDTETEVSLSEGGGWVYYSFTPDETDLYTFRSIGSCDTYGHLYNAEDTLLAVDDDSGDAYNFLFIRELTAGEQYCLGVRLLNQDEFGSFSIAVSKRRGLVSAEAVEATFVYPNSDNPAVANVQAPYGFHLNLVVDAQTTDGYLSYVWAKQDANGDFQVVEGVTSSFYYPEEAVTEPTCYSCTVSDDYGNSKTVSFYVLIENRLSVYSEQETTQTAAPGNAVTLTVTANCDVGNINYQWYRNVYDPATDASRPEAVSGEVSASIVTVPILRPEEYTCIVTDQFENADSITFYLSADNGFSVQADGEQEILVAPEEGTVLSVIAQYDTGPLSYQWYLDGEAIEDAVSESFETGIIRAPSDYWCIVTDPYENEEEVWFSVSVDNGLTASAVSREKVYVEAGGSTSLAVEATCLRGALTYEWYLSSYDDDVLDGYGEALGIDSPSCTLESVTALTHCTCEVSDEYGNTASVFFEIIVRNDLTAVPAGEATVSINPGESAVLAVNAACKDGDLYYSWEQTDTVWGDEFIYLDETTATLSTGPLTSPTRYYCTVTDEFGNSCEVVFTVLIGNEFTARAENSRITVSEVSDVTMRVIASCKTGELSYQWCSVQYDEWGDYYTNVGYESSYTAEQVNSAQKYRCIVFDEYGNEAEIFFDLIWADGLAVSPAGSDIRLLNAGDQVTLEVNTDSEGTLTYEWRATLVSSEEDGSAYLGNSEMLAISADGSAIVTCRAEDQYQNSDTASFIVLASEGSQPVFQHYSTISITQATACRVLTFSPPSTGSYTFHALADSAVCAYMFQEDGTCLTSADPAGATEIALSAELTAGHTYSIAVLFEGTVTGDILVGLTPSDAPVQHLANRIILPAGTRQIGEEAFALSAVEEIVLPQGCERIEDSAFAYCTSLQLVNIPDSVTYIADSAFIGSNVTLILQGDTAYGEAYASAHNLGWLYE